MGRKQPDGYWEDICAEEGRVNQRLEEVA